MAQHVVGYVWNEGRPELRLADRNHPIGPHLSLTLLDRRECIGYRDHDAGVRRRCPSRSAPAGAQCLPCSHREGFWACMTCDGFQCPPLSAAMGDYCRSEHVMYLACFGTRHLKVGTASGPRRAARLIEQGPLAAAHVAAAPGPLIKQMEALTVRLGYVEALRRERKWREFKARTTPDQARIWIEAAYADLRAQLPAEYTQYLHAPRFVTPAFFGWQQQLERVPLAPGESVSGEVVGARGHIVLLNDGAGAFAVDIGALKSWYVDLDGASGRTPARQLGLF